MEKRLGYLAKMILNAENLILGRLATHVAKKLLLGEKIDIINCEKAVIIGDKKDVLATYKEKIRRGSPKKGPFFPKTPERLIKRTIRGMIPFSKPRGREAFKKLKCHIGTPEDIKKEDILTLEKINVFKTRNLKFVRVEQICKYFGR